MNTIEEFRALLREELGLSVTEEDLAAPLDQVPGWDSVHVLSLLTLLERRTGRSLPLSWFLEASTLTEIFGLARTDTRTGTRAGTRTTAP
ncbi:acyl carrier protein [Actinomadura chibensis]|uniref:Acyl carrier protein n=1 Tax=Actinomadura chibensis TaxID=392828 RepID=A0A5D0NLK8_9ACTN|nr:acyl carrier protein [Actinomadura chibensis]TYB45390.1 acyl carrier protein [Actinomadura chibensis]